MFSKTSAEFQPHGIMKELEGLHSLCGDNVSDARWSTVLFKFQWPQLEIQDQNWYLGTVPDNLLCFSTSNYVIPSLIPLVRGKGRSRKMRIILF